MRPSMVSLKYVSLVAAILGRPLGVVTVEVVVLVPAPALR